MVEGLVVGPGAPHHFDHSVGVFVDQVRVLGDLAPAIFQRRQIFDAVVLHRLEQSLEPLASGRVVRRRGGQDRDQLGDGAKDRSAKSA